MSGENVVREMSFRVHLFFIVRYRESFIHTVRMCVPFKFQENEIKFTLKITNFSEKCLHYIHIYLNV